MTTTLMHTLPHHTDIGYVHRTPSADGILGEINTESALRAAVEIETGLPPAEFYENTATMHTYIHMKSASRRRAGRRRAGSGSGGGARRSRQRQRAERSDAQRAEQSREQTERAEQSREQSRAGSKQ